MFGMWNVPDMRCWGCGMFGLWDVRNLGCSGCGMFGMSDVWDVRCSGSGMWDVGCLPGCGTLIYKMPSTPNSSVLTLTSSLIYYTLGLFLTNVWLPHRQICAIIAGQPTSLDVNHCVLPMDDLKVTGRLVTRLGR